MQAIVQDPQVMVMRLSISAHVQDPRWKRQSHHAKQGMFSPLLMHGDASQCARPTSHGHEA
eukprot:1150715-Pelagomonas_calceolata.AAC.1